MSSSGLMMMVSFLVKFDFLIIIWGSKSIGFTCGKLLSLPMDICDSTESIATPLCLSSQIVGSLTPIF